MRFDVVTLFPEMFAVLTQCGVSRRAHEQGLWQIRCWDPRSFTSDVHRTVDDRPFGGGPGMVLMAEPLARCVEAAAEAQRLAGCSRTWVVALSASGAPLRDARVRRLAGDASHGSGCILVCGRYEGIDQRFIDAFVDEEICIGDFVLSGGEIGALALIDAVVRQLPGAIRPESAQQESFAAGLLDAPHYTRPESWRGRGVPQVLLSGHHAHIEQWRREQSVERTRRLRPDLLQGGEAGGGPAGGARPQEGKLGAIAAKDPADLRQNSGF